MLQVTFIVLTYSVIVLSITAKSVRPSEEGEYSTNSYLRETNHNENSRNQERSESINHHRGHEKSGEVNPSNYNFYGKPNNSTTGKCEYCEEMRENSRAARLIAIKEDILSKLRLNKTPNVTASKKLPVNLIKKTFLKTHKETPANLEDDYVNKELLLYYPENRK